MSKQYESMESYVSDTVKNGYHGGDAEPLKCFKCDSKNYTDKVTDFEGGYVCVKHRLCADCNAFLGEWSYGNWQW